MVVIWLSYDWMWFARIVRINSSILVDKSDDIANGDDLKHIKDNVRWFCNYHYFVFDAYGLRLKWFLVKSSKWNQKLKTLGPSGTSLTSKKVPLKPIVLVSLIIVISCALLSRIFWRLKTRLHKDFFVRDFLLV